MTVAKRPVAVDLFCGVGGMSLGMEQSGFDVVAAFDSEQIHIDTYLKNFPSCDARCVDLSKVSGKQLRAESKIAKQPVALLFGGPPCQGFSTIGRRLPHDPRNQLLRHFARLIAELSPSYFVVENVEGLQFGTAEHALDKFVRSVEENSYEIVKPVRTLDAVEFGVPQRRRRIFILGYRAGLTAPQYPPPLHWFDLDGEIDAPVVWDAVGDLPKITRYKYLFETDGFKGNLGTPSNYARFLRGEAYDPDDYSRPPNRNGHGLTGCLRTLHSAKTINRFRQVEKGERDGISHFHRLNDRGYALTLRAGTGPERGSYMAPRPIHPFQDRCITVREAARLHSFPDWFYFHPTRWHGFRQIGNSVPPLLARAVAKAVAVAMAT